MELNPFASRIRPPLAGHLGAISAAHPLAAAAGQEMFAAGGCAVDAVIAGQAVLSVVSPDACGLGGDAFYLVREPDGNVVAVNGAGASARSQTRPASDGGASVTVPGMVSAWEALAVRWSSLPLSRCLQPAIRLARSGHRVDDHLLETARQQRPRLIRGGAKSWSLLKRSEGEIWVQSELATTLEQIAKSGAAALHSSGDIARAVIRAVALGGGVM